MEVPYKAGFVNIVGKPNVGKSTLVNTFVKEKLSIVTSKPQTTRHRIHALLSEDHFQIVFSDTPGIINEPHYKMQWSMNKFAYSAFEDSDLILFVTDIYEAYTGDELVFQMLKTTEVPVILIINKIDLDQDEKVNEIEKNLTEIYSFSKIFKVSAKEKINTDSILDTIVDILPVHPPYYPQDQLSDRPERFFVSEIIREKILQMYRQEIPYSCEVVAHRFKEEEKHGKPLLMIYADIYVERKSQKPIIIGNKGESIKKLGIASRLDLENFFETHVFLDLNVKIKENWRDDDKMLQHFGYENN
ncbi:MAG: GTPase Era [Saprospiraceae bacterium]|nr:GTPase Era [Saprospiraceae bacterium]